jgi:ABC-type antimicrobial peptide transport system permease subunit
MPLRLVGRLLASGGKSTLSRQALIVVSVAIGTVLLLASLSFITLFHRHNARQCWSDECAQTVQQLDAREYAEPNLLVATGSQRFRGRSIQHVYVAPLTDGAVMRGITSVPGPDEYFASPELARLIATTPTDQLGDRYADLDRVGLIDAAQLDSPRQLTAIIGRTEETMSAFPDARRISTFHPRSLGADANEQILVVSGLAGLLLPVLVLIGSATRIASYRREERLAVLRLVGATRRQTKLLTALDALLGAGIGSALGVVAFQAIRHLALHERAETLPFTYADLDVPPTIKTTAVVLVPVAAVALGLVALRRVNISPLGVSRRTRASSPRARRMLPLLAGAIVFVATAPRRSDVTGAVIGFLLIMIGLLIAGPWLLLKLSRALRKMAGSAPLLIAARRMEYEPKTAFRAVGGVVMVVFLGAWLSGAAPSMVSAQDDLEPGNLQNVLPVLTLDQTNQPGTPGEPLYRGVSPARSAEITRGLTSLDGVDVITISSGDTEPTPLGPVSLDSSELKDNLREISGLIDCDDLSTLDKLGTCTESEQHRAIDLVGVLIDHQFEPDSTSTLASGAGDTAGDGTLALLVQAENEAAVDQVRTYLATHVPESATPFPLVTFGEAVDGAKSAVRALRLGLNAAVGFVLLIALVSIAVSAVGSILERRRTYTTLRLSGASTRDLSTTVYHEALLPLVCFTLFSGAIGYGCAQILNASVDDGLHPPSSAFLLILAAGLVAGTAIVWLSLPLLRKVSNPTEVRYE